MTPSRIPRSLLVLSAGLGLAVSGALTVPGAVAAPSATSAPASASAGADKAPPEVPTPPPVVWGVCTNPSLIQAGAQCGKVQVPLDYDDPEGEQIQIAVSRGLHTGSDEDYQGPMLFNPGGPGGSGLIYAALGAFGYFNADIRKSYDFIGFDPRGVGDSEPSLSCDPDYTAPVRPRYDPRKGANGDADLQAWLDKSTGYTDDCAANNDQGILDNLTTEDNALDMESIRLALDVPKINYYGFSYGTYLGQVYSTLFPSHVRRMVFDGTVDPRGIWYKANLSQNVAFETTANKWFAWIAQHNSAYHLGKTKADVRKLYFKYQAQLDKNPVGEPGAQVGGAEWSDTFLYAGYYDSTYPELAQVFSDFVNDDDTQALYDEYIANNGPGDDNGYAVYAGTECTDASWPQNFDTWKKDATRLDKKHPFLTWGNTWFNEPCRHWPGEVSQPVKIDGKKTKSVLMLVEQFDAATPIAGSYEVRKRYPGARLVDTLGGTTHANSLAGNPCVDKRLFAYLSDGTLPKRKKGKVDDVTCQALPHPSPDRSGNGLMLGKGLPLPGLASLR